MSFFEPRARRPEPDERPQVAWVGPPDDEGGVGIPLRVILVQTPALAILADAFVAYSTGFTFRLSGRLRATVPLAGRRDFARHVGPYDEDDEKRLLLGLQFADGRKALNVGWNPRSSEGDPAHPVLMSRGGGSSDRRFDFDHWVWPLPPPGSLQLVCEWKALGVDQARTEVDATPIVTAAAESGPLWPRTP